MHAKAKPWKAKPQLMAELCSLTCVVLPCATEETLLSSNSRPRRYLSCLIACPPALLQVLIPELLSLVERARVRHRNYTYRRSSSSRRWAVWRRVGWRAALCKIAVEMEENICYLDKGTGSVVKWFVSVLGSPWWPLGCGSFLHTLSLNCKHSRGSTVVGSGTSWV